MKKLLISIFVLVLAVGKSSFGQVDTTIVAFNGVVFNDTAISPLEGVAVFFEIRDTAGFYSPVDTVFTNSDGTFSCSQPEGTYYIWAYLQGFTSISYYNAEFTDSLYNLVLILIKPEISVSSDTIIINMQNQPLPSNEVKLAITNQGTGTLVYSSALYLQKQLPADIIQLLGLIDAGQGINKSSGNYLATTAGAWSTLFKDPQDQQVGQHDLKEILTKTQDDLFLIRAEFFDTIRSFNDFYFEFAINADRDTSTGTDGTGLDYIILVYSEGAVQYSIMVRYNEYNDSWSYFTDAVLSTLDPSNKYIEVGYPRSIFVDYDIMLAYASVHPGMDDYSYYDFMPQDFYNIPMLFTIETNPLVGINKFYGEAGTNGIDTLILTADWNELLNVDLDTFYIGLLNNDIATPLIVIPVIIQSLTPTVIADHGINAMDLRMYPNPFKSEIKIEYNLQKAGFVTVSIYTLDGRKVKDLMPQQQRAGKHIIFWDGSDSNGIKMPSGIYLCTTLMNGSIITNKIILDNTK